MALGSGRAEEYRPLAAPRRWRPAAASGRRTAPRGLRRRWRARTIRHQ